MKKQIYKYLLWGSGILCGIAAILFIFAYEAKKEAVVPAGAAANVATDVMTDASPDVSSDATTDPATDPEAWRSVENAADGYAFSVPQNWYVEEGDKDRVAVYPNYSSSTTCKIEMSVFSYSSDESRSDWINARIGADPTLTIAERSSENISIGAASAIRWDGTINDMPTTLIYAFNGTHAYEIAPSSLVDSADGPSECEDDLDIFLSKLNFQ
jgi:hypothetical protein